MNKKLTILYIIVLLSTMIIACGGKSSEKKDMKTMTIDLSVAYGKNAIDNATINKVAHLKVQGSFGEIDAKPDASTGASSPEGATKSLNSYRYVDVEKYKETSSMPDSLRGLLLYGVSPALTYDFDGLSGSGYARKVIGETNGAKVSGTTIKKDADGVITIRFAHAGGPRVNPTIYEMKSDTKGVFNISKSLASIKKSAKAVEKDSDFDTVEMVVDEIKGSLPYWEGDLQGTFDDDILTLKGTLTLKE